MHASTSADPAAFLSSLTFDADSLCDMKAAVHETRDVRAAFENQARDDGHGLRHAVAHYLLSQPESCLDALADGDGNDSSQAGLLRGLASLQVGDPHTAVQSLSALVGTDMEGPRFLTDLATAAALAGDADLAHKAASKLPDGADALYAEGIALEAEGDYEEARRKYEEAVAREAQHARALFRLALRLDTAGDDSQAIEMYRRCAAIAPTNVNAVLNMALLLEDRARYQDAEQCYRRILASDPNHVRARIGLKDVLASQNMYYDEDHERREDRRAQVLRTPITEFELSVRSRNCLAKMNIVTLGDLVKKTEGELLAYKNFGETSLQEIKDILAQKALRLGMTSEDDAPLYSATSHATAEAQLDALFGGTGGSPAGAPMGSSLGAPEGRAKDPLEIPIEQLDLSIRARRCMDNLEIRTVGDLVRHSEAELLASKNFGQTSLNEVRRKLDALGLSLRRK